MDAQRKWQDYQARSQRRQIEDNRTALAIGAATLTLLFWPPLRMAILISEARGRDLNLDGVFSVGDIILAAQMAYSEPAYWLLSALPHSIFDFFETSLYSLPDLIIFLVSAVAWIAVAVGIFHVARLGLTALGFAGTGMNAVDARMKGRFRGLLTGDLIVGGLVVLVAVGLTLGAVFGR